MANGQDFSQLIPVTGQGSGGTNGNAPLAISPQDLSSLLPSSQTQTNQPANQAPQTEDVSNAPIYKVRATHYGYEKPGEPGYDPASAAGKGAFNNQLSDGLSIALSPDMEARFNAKPGDTFAFTGADGTTRKVAFHDRTSQSLRGRVDIYDPTGKIGDLGTGTISKIGAGGPVTPALETSEDDISKRPASFGMRVATPNDVQNYNTYVQNGGDPNQIPIYDRLAVAIAKDPSFLSKPENFESFYGLVWKPLQQQSFGENFNKAIDNIGPTIGATVNNVKEAVVNTAQEAKDSAELNFRKATGQTMGQGYQDLVKRIATEQATTTQGVGQTVSDTWDFLTGLYNGAIQLTHPIADMFVRDPKGKEELDRQYAQAAQQTAAAQQGLSQLGKTLQNFNAAAYQTVGAYADVGAKMKDAAPNQAAVQGYSTVLNPLNYIGVGEGAAVVDAFKPLFFETGLRAAEDVSGSLAKKGVLDTTQMLPKNPEVSAANAGYVETRNAQAQFAPLARNAAQDLEDKSGILNQHLTTLGKIAGDPDTATGFASSMLQGGGQLLGSAGDIAEKVGNVPEWFANKVAGGNPIVKSVVTDMANKALFGTLFHHFGPLGGAAEAAIEHLPEIADSFSALLKTTGQELRYGQATIPYWTRVAQQTKMMPKFLASALDSPLIQSATAVTKGAVGGAVAGGVAGAVSGLGSPAGGPAGAAAGLVQGGAIGALQGMAGGGFGQWMKFRDPNQYLLQARGDWKRYRDTLAPQDSNNFHQLTPTNQLMLAQNAQHFPGLVVDYSNDPNGPRGSHYVDNLGRSHIQVNIANPDSAVGGILAHELTHGTVNSGMLPNLYDSLLGNPQRGITGQYTALDGQGKPIGVDPATGRYIANQDFVNLKNQYTNALSQSGVPVSHLTDLDIAREIHAEHGVDYLLSGGGIQDSNSAFRPGLLSKNALKTAMAKMGYTFSDQGAMVGSPGGPQVTGTGLFADLQKNPALYQLAQSYYRTAFRDGKINSEEAPTTRFTKKDLQNPNVAETWLTNSSEIMRNPDGTAMRDKNTGQPIFRTPKQVEEYNANFAQALRNGLDSLPESQRMDLGYRQQGDNVFMRYLPDHVLDALAGTNQYNPHQIAALRMLSRTLADAASPGMETRFFYHKALTANKRYSAFEGTEKIAVPYGIEITGNNNVNIKSVDFGQLTNNYLKMRSRAPFKDLWATPDEFTQDAHTYFTNHSKGDPGATGIGTPKRDAINALANFGTQLQQDSNPLVGSLPTSVRPIVKSYRIDRSNQVTATGTMRPFVSEKQYQRMNMNYLPQSTGGVKEAGANAVVHAIDEPSTQQETDYDAAEERSRLASRSATTQVPGEARGQTSLGAGVESVPETGAGTGEHLGVSYLPRKAAAAPGPPDETAIPVTMTTTKAGKPIVQKHDYGITSAPLVADKQPPASVKGLPNKFGHIDFLSAPEQQRLTHLDNASAVTTYANKLVQEYGKWADNKDVMAAKTWYKQVRGYLTQATGNTKDAEIFGHLLAATSPQQGVVQNWHDAKTAFERWKAGAYDDAIAEFKRTGKITDDMKPRKENGALFGANSDEVLKVLAGTWLDNVEGPKTPNFFANLFGRGKEATIDKWAARTMRRMGYEGVEGAPTQYRLQPKSEKGVSDLDFAFSQQAFHQAADRVGMDPHELQAILWYAEKHHWAEKGYSKGGAAAAKASYVPMLKEYAQQKMAERKNQSSSSGGSS